MTTSGELIEWVAPDESTRFVSPDALSDMRDGRTKLARRSDQFRMRGVPVRVTVVDPKAQGGIAPEKMDEWIRVVQTITAAVDNLSGPDPLRPSSLDVTLYLWSGRKWLQPDDDVISPRNANTGVTIRDLATGNTRILVYRNEEAVKTLVHEMLHAYRFGDWANEDDEMHELVMSLASAKRLRMVSPEGMKPTEALVDALAIRLTEHLFGGRSWDECFRHAERLSERLVARCLRSGGEWRQSTGAFEYYCVKPVLMRGMNEFIAAHLSGLQRPDKAKVRAILSGPSREYSPGRRVIKTAPRSAICLRMTPPRLADLP